MHRIIVVIVLLFFFQSHSLYGQKWKYYHQNEIQPTYGLYLQSIDNANRTIPELSAKYEMEKLVSKLSSGGDLQDGVRWIWRTFMTTMIF